MQNTPQMQKVLNQYCCCKLSGEQLEHGINSYGYANYIAALKEVHNAVYDSYEQIDAKYYKTIEAYDLLKNKKMFCSLLVKAIHSKYGRLAHAETLIAVKTKELKAAKDHEELNDLFNEIYCSVILD